ncbi:hypothetical protein [Priestia megaterium]|uniref:hypothetical protein n=1 Tax=Priestia megaterium TaxID=1404 RepID=UPI002E242EF1|nr:hypothetical protein [Priestia megaterium]
MSKGRVVVELFYPGYIGLEEGTAYLVNIESRISVIKIQNHLRPLEILDFDNSIVETHTEKELAVQLKNSDLSISPNNNIALRYDNEKVFKVIDYSNTYYKFFTPRSYTQLIMSFEVDDVGCSDEFEYYTNVLERFISLYRSLTRDIKIRMPNELLDKDLVIRVDAISYTTEELKLPPEERLTKPAEFDLKIHKVKFDRQELNLPEVNHNISKCTEGMITLLNSEYKISDAEEALLKAFEEAKLNNNYKYTLLESFIAVESIVMKFVNEIKIQKGVSKSKLKEYKTEVGIGYVLNIELPLLLDLSDEERKIIGNVNNIRKKRNSVVHEGEDVSKKEAETALNSAIKLMDMIEEKQNNK